MIVLQLLVLFLWHNFTLCAKQPHIIFVLVDDLGYNDLGYQKRSAIYTPNIDKLAKKGIILDRHYALPQCSPSRAALLTGKYPTKSGMYRNIPEEVGHAVPLNIRLLPELMRDLNYTTHYIGKWHLGFSRKEYFPTNRGFDTFYGIPLGGENKRTHITCGKYNRKNSCGYALYNQTDILMDKSGIYSTTKYFKRAIEIIQNREKSHEKPLFMLIAPTAPHLPPSSPPKRYLKIYENKQKKTRKYIPYAAMVTHIDYWMGRLKRKLKKLNLWNNTILVFASDNGGNGKQSSNWPLRGVKGEYYEGGVRSISFISSPLLKRQGRIKNLIHFTDWFPTLTKLGGATTTDDELDGYNIWIAINNAELENPRKDIVHGFRMEDKRQPWLETNSSFVCDTQVMGALQIGPWKLLTGLKEGPNNRRYALYNLDDDEREKHDLSQIKVRRLKEMCKKMKQYYNDAVPLERPRKDLNSNPALYGGRWVPWLDDEYKLI